MRGMEVLGACLVWVWGGAVVVGADLPYRTRIGVAEALVRSGPGEEYYATSVLEQGEEVEIHRRRPDGWLAIRPPDGSFCWVEAQMVRLTPDPQTARAVGAAAVAWIGSELGDVQDYKWQVKLDPGQPVEILSQARLSMYGGDEPREYYQIAPPSGDYRWLHEDALQHQSPRDATEDRRAPATSRDASVAAAAAAVVNGNTTAASDSAAAVVTTGGDWRAAVGKLVESVQLAQFEAEVPSAAAERLPPVPSFSSRPTGSPDGFVPRGTSPSTATPRVASLEPRPSFQFSGPGGIDTRLRQLDVEFSLMAAKSPEQWNFSGLRREAEKLLEQAETTLHRGRARLLLDQVQEFENLEKRYAGLRVLYPAPSSSTTSRTVNADDGDQPRFDGQGWLLPVHSTRQTAPPYALLDDDGKILTFVSPAPGLNLHRYVRKQVGIFGQRSPQKFWDKVHLTADRIVDLERHRR